MRNSHPWETFNPTEAGSANDGAGVSTSSQLLQLRAEGNTLKTTSRMAFWLAPGQKSGPNLAKNTSILSNHLLSKRVRIGYRDLANVISYDTTFTIPTGERHTQAVFEALTGYMPPEFETFQQFNPQSSKLEPLDDGPGEIQRPVVLSIPDGSHAMGIYSPPQPSKNMTGPTFGRFRFKAEKVVKWNCVFRLADKDGIQPGEYPFHMFVVVGSLESVRASLAALNLEFTKP